jgi:ribosomal protein S24E
MEMKILQEKDNQLLGRKEVRVEVKHTAAPSPAKVNIIKELAAKYGVPEDHVVIDYVFTKKGLASSEIKVKIYKEKPKVKAAEAKEGSKEAGKEAKEAKVEEKKSEAQVSKHA